VGAASRRGQGCSAATPLRIMQRLGLGWAQSPRPGVGKNPLGSSGRAASAAEGGSVQDSVLRVLFDYRMSPQNPKNVPMKLSDIVRAVSSNDRLVVAALDSLKELQPPYIEEGKEFQQERTFSITGSGVRFVRNMSQDLVGAG